MFRKVTSATVYPPQGDTVKYDVGKSDVLKIVHNTNGRWAFTDSIKVVFADGSERFYCNIPFHYDLAKEGRPA